MKTYSVLVVKEDNESFEDIVLAILMNGSAYLHTAEEKVYSGPADGIIVYEPDAIKEE